MRFEKIHDVIPLPTAIPQNQRKPTGHKTRERYASLCGKRNKETSILEKNCVHEMQKTRAGTVLTKND